MMKPKKVVLWGHKDVLGMAIESFLATRDEWEVVRIMEEDPMQSFGEQVAREHPDVVIVYQDEHINTTGFPYLLLQANPEIKVITLSLEDNFLVIFDKQRMRVNQISDLFSAIGT